jgi:hypothetical protein
MKIIELTNNILLPITNEETELLEKFSLNPISKNSLTEREQVLANQLTTKDVLLRTNENGKIYYRKQID